jgi:dTDP-4-amino-4,6-dideoxygalactose transaminase
MVDAFEKEFSERTGTRNAVAVCCETGAMHLALRILGTGPGDEVNVSSPLTDFSFEPFSVTCLRDSYD